MKNNHNHGFTLVELILVLTLISSFFLLWPAIVKVKYENDVKKFVEILDNSINYAKLLSSTKYDFFYLTVKPDKNQIIIQNTRKTFIETYDYPKTISVIVNFHNNRIDFSHGLVSYPGKVIIYCDTITITITISESSGELIVK